MNETDFVTEEMLYPIVQDVFTNMFGIPVESKGTVPEVRIEGRACLCSISITGAWNGNVLVQCTDELAREIGTVMFGSDADTISKPEVRDAMGEITNMVGGNLKRVLPSPSSLSLPSVMFGSDISWKVPGPANIRIFCILVSGKLLVVTIVKRAPT